jgi:predicted DNA-binding ribbon-helix-helix protein
MIKSTSLMVEEAYWKKLKKHAIDKGVSLSELVNLVFQEYLEKKGSIKDEV